MKLAFNIGGVDCLAGILHRCVASHIHLASVLVNRQVADMHCKAGASTPGIDIARARHLPARLVSFLADLLHTHLIFTSKILADAIGIIHLLSRHIPEGSCPFLELPNQILGSLNGGHAGGEGGATAAGCLAVGDIFSVRHYGLQPCWRYAKRLSCHHLHGSAGAAYVRITLDYGAGAIRIHVDGHA